MPDLRKIIEAINCPLYGHKSKKKALLVEHLAGCMGRIYFATDKAAYKWAIKKIAKVTGDQVALEFPLPVEPPSQVALFLERSNTFGYPIL